MIKLLVLELPAAVLLRQDRSQTCRCLQNKRTLKKACCVGTEADEDRSSTCKVVVFHITAGHESRGRTLPGLLGTLGTLLLLRPSQERGEQRRDSSCSLTASLHSLCQRCRITTFWESHTYTCQTVHGSKCCLTCKQLFRYCPISMLPVYT